jgi:hypothetical protein
VYLLDTNVVSELRKAANGNANAGVMAWQAGVDPAHCFVSALTMLELEIGVLRAERRDAKQGARLRAWLDESVRPEFIGKVLPVNEAVAIRDTLIAATALEHGLTVVTRNPADFKPTGVSLVNPWSE